MTCVTSCLSLIHPFVLQTPLFLPSFFHTVNLIFPQFLFRYFAIIGMNVKQNDLTSSLSVSLQHLRVKSPQPAQMPSSVPQQRRPVPLHLMSTFPPTSNCRMLSWLSSCESRRPPGRPLAVAVRPVAAVAAPATDTHCSARRVL